MINLWSLEASALKTKNFHDANFVVTGVTNNDQVGIKTTLLLNVKVGNATATKMQLAGWNFVISQTYQYTQTFYFKNIHLKIVFAKRRPGPMRLAKMTNIMYKYVLFHKWHQDFSHRETYRKVFSVNLEHIY